MDEPAQKIMTPPANGFGLFPISSSRRWAVMGLLFLACFVNYLDRASISVALPFISAELHLGPESKGVLLSSFFWFYTLTQLPIGWCVDRLDLRWLYAGLFALWSLACGVTGFAGSMLVLMLVRMTLGVGESIYLPGGTKIVSMLFRPDERGLPCGIFESATRLGVAVGAPLLGALILIYGWRRMFALVGFTALVWVPLWLAVAPRNFRGVTSDTGEARPWRIHFNRNLLGVCLGFFCLDYYWYLIVTWLPDYLMTSRHLEVVRAGFYAALPYLVYGISQLVGGWISDVLIRSWGWNETRTRKGVLTLAFLCGLFLIPAARATTPEGALVFLVGASLVGLATGNVLTILQSCAPPQELGIWAGLQNTAGNMGGILAPMLTGLLIARTHSYQPAFAVAAGVLLLGILAYWLVVGELKSPLAPSTNVR